MHKLNGVYVGSNKDVDGTAEIEFLTPTDVGKADVGQAESLPFRDVSHDDMQTIQVDRRDMPIDAQREDISGDWLRHIREIRGLSPEHIEQQTRIRPTILKAIEACDVTVLPERVYIKGFLQHLARVLGLDTSLVVDGYFMFLDKQEGGQNETN